jgi:large subunit ribosomal protein L29
VKAKDFRELSAEELVQREKDIRGKHFNFKIQRATNQLANTADITHARKDIARINTLLNEKHRSETK